MIDAYDPLGPPSIDRWIELDESERCDLVLARHQKQGDELHNPTVHAVVHVIVENRVALADETSVAAVMARLMQQGLDRHEAIHAIGYVLLGTFHGNEAVAMFILENGLTSSTGIVTSVTRTNSSAAYDGERASEVFARLAKHYQGPLDDYLQQLVVDAPKPAHELKAIVRKLAYL